jgi:gliding motility-associated-like protein
MYCSDDNQSIATGLTIGQTYTIRVYSWTSDPNQTSTFNVCIGTIPQPITVTQNEFTPEQLISEILLDVTCSGVSNITYSTGTTFGSANGVGYFENNGSSFPFDYGIVLSTGDAFKAAGPNTEQLNEGIDAWPGDADLNAIVLAQDPNQDDGLNNATVMEFDFVPITNNISFNFIFASEEYGAFQCGYTDVFAFLLTNTTTGVTTNLAVLPNSTIPVSVTTVRDELYNVGEVCPSANPQYFANYYLPPGGLSPLEAPIDYNGHTVPLTATSPVVPGQNYHIKLAIADYSDNLYDSAVFLEGGSFGIGNIDLGENLLESTGNAVCSGGSATIDTSLDPALYNFTWFNGNDEIPGETGPSITVVEEGTYTIMVNFIGTTCTGSDTVIVEFYNSFSPATPPNLFFCSSSGVGNFNLTQNQAPILAPIGSGYTLTYFLTMADATANVNAIATPTAYINVTNPQTIYVRVQSNISGCFEIVQFDLIVQDQIPQFTLPADFSTCSDASDIIAVTPINFDLANVTYAWTLNTLSLPDITSSVTVTQTGFYEVTVTMMGCTTTIGVNVNVFPTPVVDSLSDQTVCDSYTLPVLSIGQYYTGSGGTGTELFAGDVITTTQTIYVYGISGDCTDEEPFDVTVNTITADVLPPASGCVSYPLAALSPGNAYYTGPDQSGTLLNAGDLITSTQTVYIYAQSATTPVCTDQSSFVVTIGSVTADVSNDVTVCDSYTLPVLAANNNYYTGPGGTGTLLAAGSAVTTTQPLYIYAQLGSCTDQSTFLVTVNVTPVLAPIANVAQCDSYTLPAPATGSNYYTGPGATGTQLNAGDVITTGQTIYEYGQSGTAPVICSSEVSFTVSITTSPVADDLLDVTACDSYTLDPLTVGNYFTGPGGTGTAHFDGDEITTSQTMYVFAQSGTCTDQSDFAIAINATPAFTFEQGCQGADYVLSVVPSNGFDAQGATYHWTTADGAIKDSDSGQSAIALTAGHYTVTVTSGGCPHTETLAVDRTGCQIQKGISPNGDDLNDSFDLTGQDVSKLQIFNRYGTVVYERSQYTDQWYGQSDNGDELPDGTYYYVIDRNAGRTETGWIYINRERN